MRVLLRAGRAEAGAAPALSRIDFVSPGRPAIIGVSITPGAMVITRIALSARSRAAVRVSATMPPLLAAYAACPICPSYAATLAVMITSPRSPSDGSLSIMAWAASRSTLKVPTRLISITVRKSSSGSSPRLLITRPGVATPAQLTATRNTPRSRGRLRSPPAT